MRCVEFGAVAKASKRSHTIFPHSGKRLASGFACVLLVLACANLVPQQKPTAQENAVVLGTGAKHRSWLRRRVGSIRLLRQSWVGRGMAVGDINTDGRIDAAVTTNDGPVHILMNETATANHWLILELVGHKSNRDAIAS